MKEVDGRVSVNKTDPGFKRYHQLGGHTVDWRVTVDGEEVPRVVTADPETGYVLHNLLNDNGQPYIDRSRQEIAQGERWGEVKVFIGTKEGR